MKGYRFYEEFPTNAAKRKRQSAGHVVALLLDASGRPLWNGNTFDCIAGVYDSPDCGVASTGVSPDFLQSKCRRVPETRAREVHPTLFRWLDSFEGAEW